MAVVKTLLQVLLWQRSFRGFLIGVVLSFGFSIAVILGTIGIMDGFERTLKLGLKRSSGDAYAYPRNGFFTKESTFFKSLKSEVATTAPIVQTEGFAIAGDHSLGVLIRGVTAKSYSMVTGLRIKGLDSNQQACIGQELAKKYKLEIGGRIVLAFAKGNEEQSSLPGVFPLKISCIVKHGVYLKDLRMIYVRDAFLQQFITYGQKYNMVILKMNQTLGVSDNLEQEIYRINKKIAGEGSIRPYWTEYEGLLEAVEIEKISIGVVLQIIVVVALFNLVAFFLFLVDRKSKEIFLIQALGLGPRALRQFWLWANLLIWVMSCLVAIVFTYIFDMLLQHAPFLQVPGEIYVLSRFSLDLSVEAYALTFIGALVWNLLFFVFFAIRQKRRPLIELLRGQFT
jgi:ABC-type lipoprotein release transport system permease subunit